MAQSGSGSADERTAALLGPLVEGAGHVLEGVTITPAGRRRVVRVVVDLPAGRTGSLDLDAVADVSRVVADALEASDVLGGSPYVLEVTSPGVDRPLTQRRHWSRARGRLVTVPVAGAGAADSLTGRVGAVDDAGVELAVDDGPTTVPWDRLGAGRVQVEFTRPDEPEPDEPEEPEELDVPDDPDEPDEPAEED